MAALSRQRSDLILYHKSKVEVLATPSLLYMYLAQHVCSYNQMANPDGLFTASTHEVHEEICFKQEEEAYQSLTSGTTLKRFVRLYCHKEKLADSKDMNNFLIALEIQWPRHFSNNWFSPQYLYWRKMEQSEAGNNSVYVLQNPGFFELIVQETGGLSLQVSDRFDLADYQTALEGVWLTVTIWLSGSLIMFVSDVFFSNSLWKLPEPQKRSIKWYYWYPDLQTVQSSQTVLFIHDDSWMIFVSCLSCPQASRLRTLANLKIWLVKLIHLTTHIISESCDCHVYSSLSRDFDITVWWKTDNFDGCMFRLRLWRKTNGYLSDEPSVHANYQECAGPPALASKEKPVLAFGVQDNVVFSHMPYQQMFPSLK